MILPGSYANGLAPRDGQPLYPELWRGCVGAWAPCLGGTGLTIRDWSGFARHGVLTSMVPASDWVTVEGKYALDFDGTDDHIPTRVISATNDVTFSVWFNSRDVSSFRAIASDANSAGAVINMQMEIAGSAKLGVLWGSSPYLRVGGSTALTTGQLYHGAVVRSGSSGAWSYRIYLNGKQDGSGTSVVNPGSASTFTIGRPGEANTQYFNGSCIDDVRVYNRALTPSEISLLASRRGIAYELALRRRASVAVQFNRRRRLLVGAGS